MKRRRSAAVSFSALTLASATVLSACGQEAPRPNPNAQAQGSVAGDAAAAEAPLYASVADCQAQNPGVDCDAAFAQAQAEHAQTAPAFASQAECEQEWGQEGCQQTQRSGGSVFVPILAGFLLGRALGGGGLFGGRGVYRDPRGGLYSGRSYVGQAPFRGGRYGLPPRAATPGFGSPGTYAQRPGTVSRGGFGSSARSRGGIGG